MKTLRLLCVAAACAAPWIVVHAETLRCNGSVYVGDSKLSVFYKCGQPLLADSHCAPVYAAHSLVPRQLLLRAKSQPLPRITTARAAAAETGCPSS